MCHSEYVGRSRLFYHEHLHIDNGILERDVVVPSESRERLRRNSSLRRLRWAPFPRARLVCQDFTRFIYGFTLPVSDADNRFDCWMPVELAYFNWHALPIYA